MKMVDAQISQDGTEAGIRQPVLWFLITVLALWPLIGGALVLSANDPRAPLAEYFLYRSFGHFVMVVALILCALVSRHQHRYWRAKLSRFDIVLIGLVVIAFLYTSVFAEPLYLLHAPAAIIQLMTVLAIVSATSLFSRASKGVPEVVWTAIFVSMLLYLPILAYLVLAASQEPEFPWSAAFAPVQNVRWFGALLAISLAAGIATAWPRQMGLSPRPWWRPIALVILWGLLFWSGSRAQVVGLLGAIVIVILLSARLRSRLLFQSTTTAVPGLALLMLVPIPNGSFGSIQRLFGKTLDQDLNVLTSGRVDIWMKAAEMIPDRPLLGHGLLQYAPSASAKYPEPTSIFHTHSFIVESLLALGLLGGGALILLVLRLYARYLHRAHKLDFPEHIVPPTLVFTTILLMSLVSGGILFQTISIYFVLAGCALWVGLARR